MEREEGREEGKRQIKDQHEHVLVILESKLKVDYERVFDLLQKLSFLDHVMHCFHFNALLLVYVLQSIKLFRVALLNNSNFPKSPFSYYPEELEVTKAHLMEKKK